MRVWAWQIEFFVFYLLVKPQGGFRTSSAGRAIQNLGQSKDADRDELGDDKPILRRGLVSQPRMQLEDC